MVSVNQVYRHHKGGLYVVKGVGISADNGSDGKPVVFYSRLFDKTSPVYSRTQDEFTGSVRITDTDNPLRFVLLQSASELLQRNPGYLPAKNMFFPLFRLADAPAFCSAIEELYRVTYAPSARQHLFETLKELETENVLSVTTKPKWPVAILWTSVGKENTFNVVTLKSMESLAGNLRQMSYSLCDKPDYALLNANDIGSGTSNL